MSIRDLTQLKDAELIRLAQHEEENAMHVLYLRKNNDKLLHYISKVVHGDADLAADTEQDTWTKVLYYFHEHPDDEIRDFDAWLRTIAYHEAINKMRRIHTVAMDEKAEWIKDSEPDEMSILICRQNAEKTEDIIAHMPPFRQKITRLWLQGYSPKQITEMLDLAENTASSEVSKAVRQILNELNKDEQE